MQNYGSNPSNYVIGTESFRWEWAESGIMEYTESSSGPPDLTEAETASGHFAPVVYERATWTSESDENNTCTSESPCPLTSCKKTSSEKRHLGYYESVGDVQPLGSFSAPNVQKAFKGHRYFWEVAGGNGPGLTPCGEEYSRVAVGLEPPPGANNVEDQADQPFGPFTYYLTLPPRNDLRHAKGADDTFAANYSKPLSFSACADHAPGTPLAVGACGLHTTMETATFHADFRWFPKADLEREIKREKG